MTTPKQKSLHDHLLHPDSSDINRRIGREGDWRVDERAISVSPPFTQHRASYLVGYYHGAEGVEMAQSERTEYGAIAGKAYEAEYQRGRAERESKKRLPIDKLRYKRRGQR